MNLSVLLIAHAGHHNTVQILNPQHAQYGWGGVAIVMGIVATVLGGPAAVVSLGEGASGGRADHPPGAAISQTSVFGLYLLFSYVATVAWGLAKNVRVLRRPGAAADLDAHGRAPVGEAVVTVLALNSIIGISLAVNITIGKVLLDQARMAAVPRQLVRVHLVHRTP